MFQEFEVKTNPETGPARLDALRNVMREQGATAFLVPHADEHQNEYQPPRAQRLSWLTGFTGSAGFCIVTLSQAILFVDGRYTLQAAEQIDGDAFSIESLVDTPPSKWLKANMGKSDIIAYDPWLATINQVEQYTQTATDCGAQLQAVENLIDLVWDDQPTAPLGKIMLHPITNAGKSAEEKIAEIQESIVKSEADFCLLTDPASLCWLFNIRGNDVAHNPLALGFCLLSTTEKPKLFVASEKLNGDVETTLGSLAEIHEPISLIETLKDCAKDKSVLCDPNLVSSILGQTIQDAGGTIIEGRDPVVLPRAIKNEVEIEGTRIAHLRDGVAITKFLCWLDSQQPEQIDEIIAAQKLEQIRAENAKAMGSELKEISFDTISGFGSNGAIVHYRVNTKSNKAFESGNLYLSDSGGQYEDGTTDITRTVAIGAPPKQAISDFTLVLKGHIAISSARFPTGTRGVDLDVLARNALWQAGKDYAHGTGHGVGSYMNVHEGPQGISKRSMEPLQAGMIISNEPGYYVEGQYGIRIENLELVTETKDMGGNIKTHGFETLTLAPIDLRLIDKDMLSRAECDWLNAYHARVFKELSPYLSTLESQWIEKVTAKI